MKLQSVILFLATIFFFYSCEKEYSVENGGAATGGGTVGGNAIYTLDGGTGACTNAAVSGTYTAGTILSAANTITLQVEVDSIGTYIVSSSSANGIVFNGTGTFTAVGSQTITLTGTGNPTDAGTFTFTLGTSGCSFSVTVAGSTSGAAVFSLGGSPAACTGFSVAGTYTAGSALVAGNTAVFNVDVSSAGSYAISTDAVNGITFSTSGNFTSTGSQTVTLQGAGTPAADGDFTYTVTSGTNTCTFTVTTVAAGPAAAGTLDCTGATQAGTYTQGNALNSSNTISIPVNVTTAGSYSIAVAAVNGVTFSGSGTLSAGAQSIVLTGNGTPLASGNNSFSVNFGTSNCDFTIPFLPGTLPSTDYFRCKINGVIKTFNVDLIADPTELFSGVNTVAISGIPATGSDEYLDITVNSLAPISPNTYPHGFGLIFSTSYNRDENNMGWQPSSNSSPAFSVIVTSKTATRIMGTFSGQYIDFNGTGTNTKQITDGEFSVPIP